MRLKAGLLKNCPKNLVEQSRILGALSKLDEILLNPQVRTCFGTVPGTSCNTDLENQEPTKHRSKNDLYPKMELSTRKTSNSAELDQEKTSHWKQNLKNIQEHSITISLFSLPRIVFYS